MGGWLWRSLLALDFQFPMLILRSVVWTYFKGKLASPCASPNESAVRDIPIGLLYALEKTFPQATPQRPRISKPRPARAYQMLPEPWHLPRHRPLSQAPLFQGELISRGPALLPGALTGFSGIRRVVLQQWMTPGTHLHHPRLGSEQLLSPLFGWLGWGRKCPFSFRAKEMKVSHLTSKKFVQVVQTLSKLKLKAATHSFFLSLGYGNPYLSWVFSENSSNKVMACC